MAVEEKLYLQLPGNVIRTYVPQHMSIGAFYHLQRGKHSPLISCIAILQLFWIEKWKIYLPKAFHSDRKLANAVWFPALSFDTKHFIAQWNGNRIHIVNMAKKMKNKNIAFICWLYWESRKIYWLFSRIIWFWGLSRVDGERDIQCRRRVDKNRKCWTVSIGKGES